MRICILSPVSIPTCVVLIFFFCLCMIVFIYVISGHSASSLCVSSLAYFCRRKPWKSQESSTLFFKLGKLCSDIFIFSYYVFNYITARLHMLLGLQYVLLHVFFAKHCLLFLKAMLTSLSYANIT